MNAQDGKRPLVTVLGASGFIGSAVAAEFVRRPVRLRLVTRGHRPPAAVADAKDVELRTADATDPAALAAAVDGSDVVVHLLADLSGDINWRGADPVAERVNVGTMRHLTDVLRPGPGGRPVTVIYAGAASQVGLTAAPRIDGSEPDEPQGAYDRQKLAAQRVLEQATRAGDVHGITLRLPTVIGCAPGRTTSKGVVAAMTKRALAGEPITMWHDGTVLRDLLHVDDVARAFAAALEHGHELVGRHWLIGSGHGEPLGAVFRRIADLVAERTGRPPVSVLTVDPPEYAELADFHSVEIDASAFRGVTGWQPRLTLDQALERTVDALYRHTVDAPEGPGPRP
ncbi:NAD-dependent epimerase/dehydratase [Streptomyces mobaraensis NBRC 13819 = DSM 40847]|uniref:UDP-glucose 4-epimerase n=1 Tax=Streptomyces mobaraensis (strain ATCC 29032 / DSM 40847 / JCM 4168 / NBRC 13819 / NCIMB 11159 / IPCR 16-22) TaxID=1223523 RepID=M3CBX7_STRM1|nr:NAD(P)-dependent oxidoreductase [Streptomyces mobaraensis]EMF01552.1 UDP-glucose 4-epimerase [Streptomyces mobaraensis NBRC 13819 = DSM 40847]QTT72170.1 NAD-dependent epimerase/dehydratase [Streptomyces mobaraensis NBRC 13819 = DSM 40847]